MDMTRVIVVILLFLLLHEVELSVSGKESCKDYQLNDYCSDEILEKTTKRVRKQYCQTTDLMEAGHTHNHKIRSCGYYGITLQDCLKAGCCYADGMCYYPLRPIYERTLYKNIWVTYMEAEELCKDNGMKIYCLRHVEDVPRLLTTSCSPTWLSGAPVQSDQSLEFLPFVNITGNCFEEPKMVNCDLRGVHDDGITFLHNIHENRIMLTTSKKSNKKQLLCVYEVFVPVLTHFPESAMFGAAKNHEFECGISGKSLFINVIKDISITWIVKNPGDEVVKTTNAETTFISKIKADHVGRYICKVSMSIKNSYVNQLGNNVELVGSAFYSRNTTINVTISVTSASRTKSRIDKEILSTVTPKTVQVLAGDMITFDIFYTGYPVPRANISVVATRRELTPDVYFEKISEHVGLNETWRQKEFAKFDEYMVDAYRETVTIYFISEVEEYQTYTVILEKVLLVTHLHPPVRWVLTIELGGIRNLQCWGYGTGLLRQVTSSWKRDGKPFNGFENKDGQGQGYYQIRARSGGDTGVYTCTLENGSPNIIEIKYYVKVRDVPVQPAAGRIVNGKTDTRIEIPVSRDLWPKVTYNVTISEQRIRPASLKRYNVVFHTTRSSNMTHVLCDERDEILQNGIKSIQLIGKNLVLKMAKQKEGTIVMLQYFVANGFGRSTDAQATPNITVTAKEDSGPASLIENSTIVYDTKIMLHVSTSNEIHTGVEAYFKEKIYDLEKPSKSRTNTVLKTGLKPNTSYELFVRWLNRDSAGSVTYSEPSRVYTLTTLPSTPDLPPTISKLKIIQINETQEDMAVVLVRYKDTIDKTLFNFKEYLLEVELEKKEKDKSIFTKVFGVKLRRTSSAALLFNEPRLRLGNVYRFRISRIMKDEPRERSGLKEEKVFISKTHCPEPKKAPKICGVGIADGAHLVYSFLDDEASKENNMQCYEGIGRNYSGKRTTTISGNYCLKWAKSKNTTYQQLPQNYCRNPNGEQTQPWCFIHEGVREWCDIEPCDFQVVDVVLSTARIGDKGTKRNHSRVTLRGRQGCVRVLGTTNTAILNTWYDYGNSTWSLCKGSNNVTEISVTPSTSKYLVSKLAFRYLVMLLSTVLTLLMLLAMIKIRRISVKRIQHEQILERRAQSLKQALGHKGLPSSLSRRLLNP